MPRSFKITCRRADPADRDSHHEIVVSSDDIGQDTAELVDRWREQERVRTALSMAIDAIRNARNRAEVNDETLLSKLRDEWNWQSNLSVDLVNDLRERLMLAMGVTAQAMSEARLAVYGVGPVDGADPAVGDLIFDWPQVSPDSERGDEETEDGDDDP